MIWVLVPVVGAVLLAAWLAVVLHNTRPVHDPAMRDAQIKELEQAAGMCPQCPLGWTDPITGRCETCNAVTGPDRRTPGVYYCPKCGVDSLGEALAEGFVSFDSKTGYCSNCCRHTGDDVVERAVDRYVTAALRHKVPHD